MASEKAATPQMTSAQYAALAAFRYELRRFLAFSEAAAQAAGLPPQQHQALLVIAGFEGPQPPTVGVLSDRLLIARHTAAELAARMVEAGLIIKTAAPSDRRKACLTLTARAREMLAALSAAHLEELEALEPALRQVFARLRHARD